MNKASLRSLAGSQAICRQTGLRPGAFRNLPKIERKAERTNARINCFACTLVPASIGTSTSTSTTGSTTVALVLDQHLCVFTLNTYSVVRPPGGFLVKFSCFHCPVPLGVGPTVLGLLAKYAASKNVEKIF
jgi:hypothetical protein